MKFPLILKYYMYSYFIVLLLQSNFAPLHLAVKSKKDEVTKILLFNKANFDVMDGDGR